MNYHKLFICEICVICVTLKTNDYGQEAKSIGDCGEDCSSCTHSVFDRVRNDQLHETLVKVQGSKVQELWQFLVDLEIAIR